MLSRKYDGVPVRIDIYPNGTYEVRSRQNKPVPSIRKLANSFARAVSIEVPVSFVGELILRNNHDADFKDVSGVVRRHKDQSDELYLMLFDCSLTSDYSTRWKWMAEHLNGVHEQVSVVHQHSCSSSDEILEYYELFMQCYPKAEGMVVRSYNDPWSPGKRSWGYQKLLKEPTIDLLIVGVEEAVDKYGELKGMAGRLIASYKGSHIGIGPGRMPHKERIELWEQYQREASHCCCGSPVDHYPDGHSPISAADYYCFPNRIAQIKHKGDNSYDALRQPTFQCWRPDKDEPDA